jgi:radical SAM superfamily enzyme YgiQ (UPF0313 family)
MRNAVNILLVNPPSLHQRRRGKDWMQLDPSVVHTPYYTELLAWTGQNGVTTVPGEHLGLQSLQSSLEADGHHVTVLNACVELHSSLAQTRQAIHEADFGLIGFSGPLEVLSENLWLARSLREDGYTGHITLGHDFATLNHQRVLSLYRDIDFVVRGEGEITLREVVRALEEGRTLKGIAGVTFREDGGIVSNPSRPVVENLDDLPWVSRGPTRTVVDIGFAASMYTRRGCPFECAFCTTGAVPAAEGITGRRRWRRRSASSVVDEMAYLNKDLGIRHITIVDDLYVTKGKQGSQHALEVAEEILRRGLHLDYMIDCRIDSIDREVFTQLRRSGLRRVYVGVESGSDEVLLAFRKGYAAGRVRDQLRILTDLDLDYILGFIMFTPTATVLDLEQNLRLLSDLDIRDKPLPLFFQAVTIYPGTPLEADLARQGLLQGEFPHYTFTYRDGGVRRLRELMSEFGRLALPLLTAIVARVPAERRAVEAATYRVVRSGFGDMIACCQRDDGTGLEAAYDELVDRFRALTTSGAAA